MPGSQVDHACAFCASSHIERLRRSGANGDLTDCRCLTCNKTWAEALTEPVGSEQPVQPELANDAPSTPASTPPPSGTGHAATAGR